MLYYRFNVTCFKQFYMRDAVQLLHNLVQLPENRVGLCDDGVMNLDLRLLVSANSP